jgi:methylisocitrate lyase
VDARNEGKDIFILARTDSLIMGWDEAMARAKEFRRMGADGVFVEALPDRDAMRRCVEELQMPLLANSEYIKYRLVSVPSVVAGQDWGTV